MHKKRVEWYTYDPFTQNDEKFGKNEKAVSQLKSSLTAHRFI